MSISSGEYSSSSEVDVGYVFDEILGDQETASFIPKKVELPNGNNLLDKHLESFSSFIVYTLLFPTRLTRLDHFKTDSALVKTFKTVSCFFLALIDIVYLALFVISIPLTALLYKNKKARQIKEINIAPHELDTQSSPAEQQGAFIHPQEELTSDDGRAPFFSKTTFSDESSDEGFKLKPRRRDRPILPGDRLRAEIGQQREISGGGVDILNPTTSALANHLPPPPPLASITTSAALPPPPPTQEEVAAYLRQNQPPASASTPTLDTNYFYSY